MNRIFVLIIALSFSQLSSGQHLGLKFGTNVSRMEGSFSYYQTKNQIGMQGGISFSYPLDETFNIRPEFLFAQKGGKVDYTLESFGAQWKLNGVQRINFIEIPLNIDVVTQINEKHSFILTFGAYWATAVGGILDLENDFTDFENPRFTRVINYNMPMEFVDVVTYEAQSGLGSFEEEYGFIKKNDYGIRFGIGWQISRTLFDFTYIHGLANMNPHEQGVISTEIEKNTRSIQFNITYFLPTSPN